MTAMQRLRNVRSRISPNAVDRFVAHGIQFKQELESIKADNRPKEFTWYGYDILRCLHHFSRLFPSSLVRQFEQLKGPVADIGGADGDLAFLFERAGIEAELIDYPPTNWNHLRGAYRLKELLQSNVSIHEVDLDSQFELPHARYELIFLLAILYHLKNPFYVLEQLAARTRFLILSTRIARQTPDGTEIKDAPLAYLVGPDECNNDATNYWIFSEAGLRQIVDRAGWDIRVMFTAGDTEASNPRDSDRDERAWLTLESRSV